MEYKLGYVGLPNRECPYCRKKFNTKIANQIYCSERCQRKAYALKQGQTPRERKAKTKKQMAADAMAKATGQVIKTLDDWAREARDCNLDYGNYRALIASGKTYEELKATAGTRTTPAHASNHKWI